MVFLVAQNGGFPGFDEVARHFESVAWRLLVTVPSELWAIAGNESQFKYLD